MRTRARARARVFHRLYSGTPNSPCKLMIRTFIRFISFFFFCKKNRILIIIYEN